MTVKLVHESAFTRLSTCLVWPWYSEKMKFDWKIRAYNWEFVIKLELFFSRKTSNQCSIDGVINTTI